MTHVFRSGMFGAILALGVCAASAQPPSAAAIHSTVQAQQVRQQQVRNQQAQQNLHEQLRQTTADAAKRPSANNAALSRQLDQSDEAARQRDQARQRGLRDAYQRVQAPPPANDGH